MNRTLRHGNGRMLVASSGVSPRPDNGRLMVPMFKKKTSLSVRDAHPYIYK